MLVYVKNGIFEHITDKIFPVSGPLERPLPSCTAPISGGAGTASEYQWRFTGEHGAAFGLASRFAPTSRQDSCFPAIVAQ